MSLISTSSFQLDAFEAIDLADVALDADHQPRLQHRSPANRSPAVDEFADRVIDAILNGPVTD